MKKELLQPINFLENIQEKDDIVFFTKLLIKKEICNNEQINDFINCNKELWNNAIKGNQNTGNDFIPNLIYYLLNEGITDKEKIAPLLQDLKEFRNKFGRIAIELKKLTQLDIETTLEKQKTIKSQRGKNVLIGKIFEHFGILTMEEINNILSIQKEKLLKEENDIQFFLNNTIKDNINPITFSPNCKKVDENNFFIKILFEKKICTMEQIEDFLNDKENLGDDFIQKLVDYLIKKGITNIDTLNPILDDINKFSNRFGNIAIELNKLTKKKLNNILLRQESIKKHNGCNVPIGKILKHLNVLSDSDINEILNVQKERSNEKSLVISANFGESIDTTNTEIDKINKSENTECEDDDFFDATNETNELNDDFFEDLFKEVDKVYKKNDDSLPQKSDENVNKLKKDILVEFSSDGMIAKITQLNNEKKDKTIQKLKTEFKSVGINFGIVSDEKLQNFIDNPILPFICAKGSNPEKSQDSSIIDKISFFKDNSSQNIVNVKKNKKTGMYDLPIISKDDILKVKIPKMKGKTGFDVFGKEIYSLEPIEKYIKFQNTKTHINDFVTIKHFDKDKNCKIEILKALIGGVPCENDIGEILIKNKVYLDGDIDYTDFNDNGKKLLFEKVFDGDIKINGNTKNIIIACNDLQIKGNIKNSKIYAKSFVCLNGLDFTKLYISKNLKISSASKSLINANGNVIVDNNISKSLVNCKFLEAENIDACVIKTTDGLKTKNINLSNKKKPIIFLNTPIIEEINEIISEINTYGNEINNFLEITIKKANLNNLIKDLKIKLSNLKDSKDDNDIKTLEMVKNNILKLKEDIKDNDKKQNKILELLSQKTELKSIIDLSTKNKYVVDKLINYIDSNNQKIAFLKNSFLEKRKTSTINISKTLSDIIIKTPYQELKISKDSQNIILYENLILEKNGLYKTKLSEKQI